jgi:predicted small metal-binding protein
LAKKFKCSDIGMNCGYEVTANTQQDLMSEIAGHAKSAHGMTEIPKEVLAKVEAAIKEI